MEPISSVTSPLVSDDHGASSWMRVKDAFRRDWEQTKARFAGPAHLDLHQHAGDTSRQSIGHQPIPSATEPTHPATHRDARKAHDHLLDETDRANPQMATAHTEIAVQRAHLRDRTQEIRNDLAEQQDLGSDRVARANVRARDQIGNATHEATEGIADAHASMARAATHRASPPRSP